MNEIGEGGEAKRMGCCYRWCHPHRKWGDIEHRRLKTFPPFVESDYCFCVGDKRTKRGKGKNIWRTNSALRWHSCKVCKHVGIVSLFLVVVDQDFGLDLA